jgi:hypothetical protein
VAIHERNSLGWNHLMVAIPHPVKPIASAKSRWVDRMWRSNPSVSSGERTIVVTGLPSCGDLSFGERIEVPTLPELIGAVTSSSIHYVSFGTFSAP